MASTRRNLVRTILGVAALCLIVWLVRVADPRLILRLALERIQGLGALAPVLFILAYVISCLIFFPGIILILGAGIVFGVLRGTVYVCIGATLGAACAFLVSRYLARDWIFRKFSTNPYFLAIDQAVAQEGWKVVALLRLSPVFPFILMNILLGVTAVPLTQFVLATAVAIIPNAVMFVYLGSLLGDLAALGTQPIATGRTKWIVSGVGIATTVFVTAVVTRFARKALARKMPDKTAA